MLLYPNNIEERLEVDQIRDLIKDNCVSESGKQRVDSARATDDFEKLSGWLAETNEFLQVLTSGETRPQSIFDDIQPSLNRIKVKGTYLDGIDFRFLAKALLSLYDWTQFFKKRQNLYPVLCRKTIGFVSGKNIVDAIYQKIDEEGIVRDDASPVLQEIRSHIRQAEKKVRNTIHKVLDKAKKDDFTEDDSAVTIREGRLVIPVRAEFKRKLSGFVHDESSTGQTVFMEPTEVLELNNEVRELRYREKREIISILIQLSDLLREELTDLEHGGRFLTYLDFVHAKAKFGVQFEACVPKLKKQPGGVLQRAYHPLLWYGHRQSGKMVEPLQIAFDSESRFLIISGPNAGGKSVALKTIGILQYMLQCGFPVPVSPDSEMGVYRNIFLDIGDSQSLENDLSTYSSHLAAMKYFTEFADKKTIILIDEFGTGTEPRFGGAIAESVLEQIAQQKSYGVATTHYSNLKEFAEDTPGFTNGAMRYDRAKLQPMFQLEIGKPGSSFALEISKKIGLNEKILLSAENKIGVEQVNYDHMLNELEAEKAKYLDENKRLRKSSEELADLRRDYEELREALQKERKIIIKEAKEEAKRIVGGANKKVERAIREIKETRARKEETKRIRENLKKFEEGIKVPELKSIKKPKDDILKVGDQVIIDGQDTVGEIVNVKGKQAEVTFGTLKSFVALTRLEKISNRQAKEQRKAAARGVDINRKMAEFSRELDLRGKRAEEVLPMVDTLVDEALMLGVNEVRILHGKGHGILREIIRNHVRNDPNILKAEDEHVERGGSGITLLTLR
ncbi:MAG: Smr/MutS family protein [Cyclobacteriaceae bacterium]|nr:Smr/MutS family protein [Cyclobacteriaceae bacterium HetDA_MAG_MS6]